METTPGLTKHVGKLVSRRINIIKYIISYNAAIEAARAGQHGKGFAVVAAEVRKLAEKSAMASRQIGEFAIESVNLADQTMDVFGRVTLAISSTAAMLKEISNSSEEQNQGLVHVNKTMNLINQTTQNVAAASEELSATSENMKSRVEDMETRTSYFRIDYSES